MKASQLQLPGTAPKRRARNAPRLGRPPNPGGPGQSHLKRPALLGRRTPVHATVRVREHVWNLRSKRCFIRICAAIAKANLGLRVIHFAVLGNHLHLIVEAEDEKHLARAMQGLLISMAKRLNALMNRHGSVFADRYHAHALATPTEVRNAIAYVLENFARHFPDGAGGADRFSSAAPDAPRHEPKTWLLRVGWRRARHTSGGHA